MKRLRGKLTYSNVMVTVLAVLVLGGGSAYAASQLAKNSVGTKQLQNGAVTPEKLSRSAKPLTGGPALTGAPGPTGATGPMGPAGGPGAPGERGPEGTVAIGPWHLVGTPGEIPFAATFSNLGPTAAPVRFRLEGDVVRFDGIFESSQSGTWSEFPSRLVMTLPEGFRPPNQDFIGATPQSENAPGQILINPDGTVYVLGEASGWGDLVGITFTTD